MSQKKTRGSLVGFTLGLAAGAGLVAYLNKRARNAPFSLPDQQRIGRAGFYHQRFAVADI